MANTGKSVKLFNLEDRKNQTGSVTEIDIYQWKNTLIDNLSKDPEFKDHCKDTSRLNVEKVPNRGFTDAVQGVLRHLSKGQLSKDHFVQGTLVQEDFCPRRHWSKETIVQG